MLNLDYISDVLKGLKEIKERDSCISLVDDANLVKKDPYLWYRFWFEVEGSDDYI